MPYLLIRDSKTLWDKVDQWFADSPAKLAFADAKGICKAAVAEYFANQEGYTMYAGMAVRDSYWYEQDEAKKILEHEAEASRQRIEYEKQKAQREKEDALYQSAASKLTSSELHALQKRFRR